MAIYRVTISHEDGDFTKDYNNMADAEKALNEAIVSLEERTHTIFWPYDSITPNRFRLFKDKKGRSIRIDKIEKDSCIKKDTLSAICDDSRTLADIEHTENHSIFTAPIVFVDENGNQYEYDGVCISEGKLKVSIKSNKPHGLKIKKRYLNSDGKLVTDLLPFNFETNEAIRKERELMPPENFLTRSEIDLYLNDGLTIHTFQASYCKEGHEFSPI